MLPTDWNTYIHPPLYLLFSGLVIIFNLLQAFHVCCLHPALQREILPNPLFIYHRRLVTCSQKEKCIMDTWPYNQYYNVDKKFQIT